jgi:predicted dehydrogenase
VDIANARLRFASGCVANLTASRISQTKVRKLRVWERRQYISVDYLTQQTLSYRLVRTGEHGPEIQCEDAAVEHEEPLKLELADFLEAVVGRHSPRVSGTDGLRGLQLATQIIAVMEQ